MRIIEDYKATSPKRKPKNLQELSAGMANRGEGEEEEVPPDNLLFSLLANASDEDVAKVLGETELLSFGQVEV